MAANEPELTVLIVPCGMETSLSRVRDKISRVLIVPCGMETGRHGYKDGTRQEY